jgi:hypothetical protein
MDRIKIHLYNFRLLYQCLDTIRIRQANMNRHPHIKQRLYSTQKKKKMLNSFNSFFFFFVIYLHVPTCDSMVLKNYF